LTFNGLQDVIFQKIVLFITTAVRTSNPTKKKDLLLRFRQRNYCYAGNAYPDIYFSEPLEEKCGNTAYFVPILKAYLCNTWWDSIYRISTGGNQ
jgi:hypothetical protein